MIQVGSVDSARASIAASSSRTAPAAARAGSPMVFSLSCTVAGRSGSKRAIAACNGSHSAARPPKKQTIVSV